jgi:hypothetical protein
MIVQKETKEQIDFARAYLEKGGIAHRGNFDGDNLKQLFGLLAQIIVGDICKCSRPINSGFDGGWDLMLYEKKYDVKCEIRSVDFKKKYVHNLNANQKNYKTDGYIFVSYNKEIGEFTVCGKITKDKFFEKAIYRKVGDRVERADGSLMDIQSSFYELENKYLEDL